MERYVLVLAAVGFPFAALALEAVVQGEVGAGSAMAGSLGAVNARADALQANQSAANMLIQQQGQEIEALRAQVSQTLLLLQNGGGGGGGGSVSSLTTVVNGMSDTIQRMIACNSQGKVWDGTNCKTAGPQRIMTTVGAVKAGCGYPADPSPPSYNKLEFNTTCASRWCATALPGSKWGMETENGPGYNNSQPWYSNSSTWVSVVCGN